MGRFSGYPRFDIGHCAYTSRKPDMDAEPGRIPVCILIDTSGSMRPYELQLKKLRKK